MILKSLCRWILYKRLKWHTNITENHPNKYIICLAPHTSNWDFIIGLLYSRAEGLKSNFLMKKEWFWGPLDFLFRKLGGIPVLRTQHTNMTETLVTLAKNKPCFHLCITPEGTRSANPNWKKGFYYIAYEAKIPILLYGIDYRKHIIECTKTITPNGDIDKQMKEIKLYFKNFVGLKPQNFIIDD